MAVILLFYYDLEIETITLSSIYQTIESTVDRGQRIRLDCSMILSQSLRDITYIWLANDVEVSRNNKVVIVANSDEEYVCVARGFADKSFSVAAIGFINITVTGIVI